MEPAGAADLARTIDGAHLTTVGANGRRIFTPLVIVMIALGTTDLIFALDSIPAIFGLTKEPYLVFTANVFALMGLRQLYFLLGGLLDRLHVPVHRAGRGARLHRRSSWCWRRCTPTTCRSSTAASR